MSVGTGSGGAGATGSSAGGSGSSSSGSSETVQAAVNEPLLFTFSLHNIRTKTKVSEDWSIVTLPTSPTATSAQPNTSVSFLFT